jgi:DNA-binding LacI/PurR family transcriptional regulator
MLRKPLISKSTTPTPVARPATLIDVAKLAGVSRSTASAVLNGACSSTRTSPPTRERVRQAADTLGYHPNAVARSLRHHVMNTIGFYSGYENIDTRHPFLSAALAGMHTQCDRYLCDVLVHRISLRKGNPDQIQEIMSGKVDGVVLWTYADDPVVDMLLARRFPAVAIADNLEKMPSVTADNSGGARLLARRLSQRGHKHVLYRMPIEQRASADERYAGFLDEARPLGMKVDIGVSADYEGKLSDAEVLLLTAPETDRPTAIACWNDATALETYLEFKDRGWSGRFALVGFDGFETRGLAVTLTTVRVPWESIGSTAVDMIRQMIAGHPVESHVVVPVTLIEGDSD